MVGDPDASRKGSPHHCVWLVLLGAVTPRRDVARRRPMTYQGPAPGPFGGTQFRALMDRLARSWESLDTEGALECFTDDAVYMEPPDIQLYQGHSQLESYFGALVSGTTMRLHNVWFDEEHHVGAVEYTFGMRQRVEADHGVAVVEIEDGRIARWREYQRKGSARFEDFVRTDGKRWEWSIGNYP